jgi:hypothetical protein
MPLFEEQAEKLKAIAGAPCDRTNDDKKQERTSVRSVQVSTIRIVSAVISG